MEADRPVFGIRREILLAVVVAGALAAVTISNEKTSSFAAGVATGAGLSFVISFLRNPRLRPGETSSEAKSERNAEDIDRRG